MTKLPRPEYQRKTGNNLASVKTREEIENEYVEAVRRDYKIYLDAHDAHGRKRAAALAELDNPTARLIAAVKEHMNCRECLPLCISCQKTLRDAIDYAEQRRTQWL